MVRAISFLFVVLVSSCTSLPQVDPIKTDAKCAQQCNVNYTTCIGGFHLFPLQNQWECTDAMKFCINTCPAPEQATATNAISAPPTIEQRLTELNELHKKGLITDAEFEAKKKEILKSM